MTASLPTQEQVNRIAQEFAPDVVRIKMDITTDWAGEPAVYFRVILSDDVIRDRRYAFAKEVERRIHDDLHFDDLEHFPYVLFRLASEQAELREPAWD